MQKLSNNPWLGPLLSGLLTFFAVCHINFLVSWICYLPLFIAITGQSKKNVLRRVVVFGCTFSVLAFFWMIPGAQRFTGSSMLYGLGVFLISTLFYTLYCVAIFFIFLTFKKKEKKFLSIIINALLIASLFCLAESLLSLISIGLPWFDVHSGNGLAENLYTIQPASVFGIHILSFIVVFFNYLIATILFNRFWKYFYAPAITLVFYLLWSFLLFRSSKNILSQRKEFSVAILAENIPPEIVWNNNTGNILVKKILDLNRAAVALKPDMALWSESAIPWTFRQDDDLVKEIFRITDPAKITHILGMNTAWKENQVFNSAYCILPGEKVMGRYDKQYLLSFIEKPLNGWLMPFFSSNGYSAVSDMAQSKPLVTPFGKAGILICNEAALPAAASNQVKDGAGFFMIMSNDGWFDNTYIVQTHFYYARLRAVESRKDVAINCNNGYSGLINASGEIIEKQKSDESFIKMVTIKPNSYVSIASVHPEIFLYACAGFIFLIIIFRLISTQKTIASSHNKK